ncbi:hypothetical protein SELMODRAFT_186551 [Selaginella moellendorffii]|uniref:Xaa-Pro aminopeptidase n=1 Tax=Selaginella moellendorffii TaxID=88036 RepID=D8T8Z2_SELML|nr:probable Xaa-Pro aminopeptidase P isoform X2 [Selaginella moellendorffii]EFJ06918.1 hypothetical protein SELMODRAFT_186551 [Selaginella moellendorffii]|eukprot:XP_002992069.1 probable Xaa-Pro aminopeptidase P isoform X2 [Selaginella moellendorffii]
MDPLDALRPLMASRDPPLDALIVPSEDAHQSEYVADRDKRREFVSGFSGSAGLAVITKNEALLWTDGRYFLQATQQLSERWKLMRIGEDPVVESWLADNLESNASVGVDAWCVSVSNAKRWREAFAKKGIELVKTERNLVDEIWKDRPAQPVSPVTIQPLEFAGRSVAEKLADIRGKLSQERAFALVVSTLDEVAWLFNLRGSDVMYNPVVHAYAIVTLDSAFYYVDKHKITAEVERFLTENQVVIKDYEEVVQDLDALVSCPEEVIDGKGLIWIDPNSCPLKLYPDIPADEMLLQQSPIALSKALKHPAELEGLRNSHVRDGVAVVSFFAWLDNQMQEIYGAPGYFLETKTSLKRKSPEVEKLTEISVSDKLEEFRSTQKHFRGLSFETISSVGANAAVIHYAAKPESCAELDPDSIYLCDSGGQYLDGTTDITRTVHFGKPSPHEKACYTQVLKGHIALDSAIFPNGTTGHALDVLARVPLWKSGLDYRHGTGHGVGSYLNVHEGPHLISFKPQARNVPLQASMTVTDEPGYYEDGKFGVRLENVLIVKEAQTAHNFSDKGYLCFEHITWVPFQRKLIDMSLLSPEEIAWVNEYHVGCREKLGPHLSGVHSEWLLDATQPL